MAQERHSTLGFILTVISVLVGLPGFLFFFVSREAVVGILTTLIVVVLLGAAWLANQPQITVLDYDKTLTLRGPTASEAIQTSVLEIRANQNGVRMFHLGNFTSDGSVREIKVYGRAPTIQRVRAGEIEVLQELPSPLRLFHTEKVPVSVKYIDSFPRPDTEAYTHVVGHKTKRLSLTVEFDKDKPYDKVRGFMQYGGQVWANYPVEPLSGKAKLLKNRPRLGSEFRIEWDWQ
jgi:hypothetical protein